MQSKPIKSTLLLTCLAIFVVGLGAYTRLSDSGLGCPDWPGCFGKWVVDNNATSPALSTHASYKAWTEMIHRYLAGILGLLVISHCYFYNRYQHSHKTLYYLNLVLACLIIIQALFGMWTVTWKLHPLAVMPHLLGGMSITSMLFTSYLMSAPNAKQQLPLHIIWLIRIATCSVCLQIILGGWTSANYAQLICPDFPTCQGSWLPKMHFSEAFGIAPIGPNYEGGQLSTAARTAIHYSHRLGGLLACVIFTSLSLCCYQVRHTLSANYLKQLIYIIILFTVQISLGIANIILALPMSIAVMHNICALLLLLTLIKLWHMSVYHAPEYITEHAHA